MGGLLKRLRGVLGLGLLGGTFGGLFGGLWWIGSNVLGVGGMVFGSLAWTAALWGGFGAFAATGAGLWLAMRPTGRTLDELSWWRVGAFGAIMGILAPPTLVFVMTGSFWGPGVGMVAGMSGLLGGVLGSGLVLTAKKAPSDELHPGGRRSIGSG